MSGKKKKKGKVEADAPDASTNGTTPAEPTPRSGSKNAYDKFIQAAEALDRRDLLPLRGDVWLAFDNAQTALREVLSRETTIRSELPAAGLDQIREIPELVLAVAYADEQLERATTLAEELEDLVHRARRLRKRLLKTADVLAGTGAVDEGALEKIRRGDDAADAAEDLLELAALIGANEGSIKKKKHAVSGKKLAESVEVGAEIRGRLKPGGPSGNGSGSTDVARAEEMRDRLWTLLNERYQKLWRVGAYLFGQAVEERLPSLQSRASLKKGLVKARKRAAAQAANG